VSATASLFDSFPPINLGRGPDPMPKVFFRFSHMTKCFFFSGGLAQLGVEEMTKLVFRYSQLNIHLMVDEEDKPRHLFAKVF